MKVRKNIIIDNVAIRRRIDGHHTVDLTHAERLRAIRTLNRDGLTDMQIATKLGYSDDVIGKWRRRLELPSNTNNGRRLAVA